MSDQNKTYLGDGVYASFDGFMVAITCDCMSVPNTIFLEPPILERLNDFYKRVTERREVAHE